VRWLVLLAVVACNDVRDFRGGWSGTRVGDAPAVRVGVATDAHARLAIDSIDLHGLTGRLDVDGLVADAPVVSLAGAEADTLATMTFATSPLRVYLAFSDASDGGGSLLVMIALFDPRRVELRLMRGGASPVYAVFALSTP
jgi:hypothetical protein